MELKDIGTVIVRRVLTLSPNKEVTVLVGLPQEFPEGTSFYCPYQITGLAKEKLFYAGGVDAIQAFCLALEMIGVILYTSAEYKVGHLSWEAGRKGELGFPVPNNVRDLLPYDD